MSYMAEGMDVRIADFNDVTTLNSAFSGITKVLLISTMETNRLEQHQKVVDAAVRADVKHVLYTGLAIKDIATSNVRALMESHFQTEDHIKKSGLVYTFLRNSMYADAIPLIVGNPLESKEIRVPGGNGAVPYVLRREMGEAIANLLVDGGFKNQEIDITATKSYTYADIARTLGAINGVDIAYVDENPEVYGKILTQAGLPEFMIYLTCGTIADIKSHQYEINSSVLDELLSRPSAELSTMLEELYKNTNLIKGLG